MKHCESLKKVFSSRCISNSLFSSGSPQEGGIACLEFFWPWQPPRAGQFFLVKAARSSVFLGRPISVAGCSDGVLRFIIAVRGRGSRELAGLRREQEAELIGPLGNFWALDGIPENSRIALAGGGIGIAPLLAFGAELKSGGRKFDFYAGFKTAADAAFYGLGQIEPENLIVSSEDGSLEKKGRITDHLNPEFYGGIFACGPELMLKTIADISSAAGVPCFISMERNMACGTGACLGCVVRISQDGINTVNRCCCSDGPIFNAREIVFGG